MIDNRVRIITSDNNIGLGVEGILKKIDEAGVIVYRQHSLPEGQGNVFIPMHRVKEIVDLGRS